MNRSIIAVAAAAVVALAVSLCGVSGSVTPGASAKARQPAAATSTPLVTPEGDRRARSMLPRLTEMASRYWNEATETNKIRKCPELDFSSLSSRGKAARDFVYDHGNGTDYDELSSAAIVFESAAAAAAIQRRMSSRAARRCLRSIVNSAFKKSTYSHAPLGWSAVESGRFPFPSLGDESTAFRVALTGTGKGGLSMLWGLDLITVRQGRALAYVISLNGLSDRHERALLRKVEKRMKAAT